MEILHEAVSVHKVAREGLRSDLWKYRQMELFFNLFSKMYHLVL